MHGTSAYDRAAREQRAPPLESGDGHIDLRECVRLGSLAASSHNTQPWRFRLGRLELAIRPDFSRRCPIVDPDDEHLYKSLGCAAENVVHAAAIQGHDTRVVYRGSTDGVHVEFGRGRGAGVAALARAIPDRQCTKLPYDGRQLPRGWLDTLARAGTGRGVETLVVTDRAQLERIGELVAAGDRVQLEDAAFRRELVSWIRFNPATALAAGDGLAGRTTRQPALPDWLGHLCAGALLRGSSQAELDVKNLRSSAGIAVTVVERGGPESWIEAGRAWERFALQATALGVRTAFLNQPVEVPVLRLQLASLLGLQPSQPVLLTRFGRGPTAPYSLRRPLPEVLDDERAATGLLHA